MSTINLRCHGSYLMILAATFVYFAARADAASSPNPVKVVMVDQYGADDEDVKEDRSGETYPLRKWLAAGDANEFDVRHIKINQLDRRALDGVRLVVIAGIRSPGANVLELRRYVERGGSLIVAAGGEFDQASWNETAWLGGRGILPAPLRTKPIGALPGSRNVDVGHFRLQLEGLLEQPYFHVNDVSQQERRRIFGAAVFFKAIRVDLTSRPSNEVTQDGQPRVLARFDLPDKAPYLVERQIGGGKVLFIASGLKAEWNTMSSGVSVLAYDRILRGMAGLQPDPRPRDDRYQDLQPGRGVVNQLNAGNLDDTGWCRAQSKFGDYAVDLPGRYIDTMLRIDGKNGTFMVMHQLMTRPRKGGEIGVGFMEMHGDYVPNSDPFEKMVRQNKDRGTLAGHDKVLIADRQADHLSIVSKEEVGDVYRIKTDAGDYLILLQYPNKQAGELARVRRRILATFQIHNTGQTRTPR